VILSQLFDDCTKPLTSISLYLWTPSDLQMLITNTKATVMPLLWKIVTYTKIAKRPNSLHHASSSTHTTLPLLAFSTSSRQLLCHSHTHLRYWLLAATLSSFAISTSLSSSSGRLLTPGAIGASHIGSLPFLRHHLCSLRRSRAKRE